MLVEIHERDKDICKDNRYIVVNVSFTGHSWTGTPSMSLEDLMDLRKSIRKYINSKKKLNGNKSKIRLSKSKRRS